MKYTIELEVNQPLDKVIELFDNSENMFNWQPELTSFDHLSGPPGEVGAQSVLKYQMGRRNIEMIETITKKNLPDSFGGTYEVKGMMNYLMNEFKGTNEGKTSWTVTAEFIPKSFLSRLMIWIMPGAFKKQTRLFMERFKKFAEQS